MKRKLLSIIAATSAFTAFAQLPVSNDPENKKVVLEEFTGIYCGYCPDGHRIANEIHDADPDNVVLVNIHTGGFAVVNPGEPDLITYAGAQIAGMPTNGITGYPAGTMNRTILTGTVMAGDRNYWTSWASTIKAEQAYANVALEGFIDTVTTFNDNGDRLNVLTVNAEVYYTADSPVTSNSLSIVLLEDSVIGPQHNYGNPYYNLSNYNADGTYNHNHVLRALLTPGKYGMKIPTTTSGTTFTASVSYTIPATYGAAGKENPCKLPHLHLAAFVTENYKTTINANHGPISYQERTYVGIKNNTATISGVSLYPNPTNGLTKVRINANKADNVTVLVYNQVGQIVYDSSSKDIGATTTDFDINTQNWATGLYSVVVKGKEGAVAKKLNVIK